jgi:hypothetical protein
VTQTAGVMTGMSTGSSSAWPRRNVVCLAIFGPVLIVTGVVGLVVPPERSPLSGVVPYDLFHIAFGLLGTALAIARRARPVAMFNLGFGLIDLYQAAAGVLGIFPAQLFALRAADHVVHVVLGVPLVVVGALGLGAGAAEGHRHQLQVR